MTRRTLQRRLFLVTIFLASLIVLAVYAKLSGDGPLAGLYDVIKDMSLLIATLMAAYLAHVFQKRSNFLQSLREEWRDIVIAKSELISYCDREQPVAADYAEAYKLISQCIDHMRIVYANVGETKSLLGFYPYEPLHDMRRAMEDVDPRRGRHVTVSDRRYSRDQIKQAFNALREHFLDEFDVEAPTRPIIGEGAKRRKKDGGSVGPVLRYRLKKSGLRL